MTDRCAVYSNTNEWVFMPDPTNPKPPAEVVMPVGSCSFRCEESNEPCPELVCHVEGSDYKLVYDGYEASGPCQAGYRGTACWQKNRGGVDHSQWILAQRNSAGEAPMMQLPTPGWTGPAPWIDFAEASWPYLDKDKRAPPFYCSRS
jgi:hypothetical protein